MLTRSQKFFFINNGYSIISRIFNQEKIGTLSKELKRILPNEKNIFYRNLKTFKKIARFKKITPGLSDNNILLNQNIDLNFIEKNKIFNDIVKTFFGGEFYIESKWLIKILPLALTPNWVSDEVKDIGIPQLNMYIKNKYRDVTYLNGIDYHQDNGGKLRNSTTVLIYLDPVLNSGDSPVRMLERSHILGATQYPHYCRLSSNKKDIYYSDLKGNHMYVREKQVYGQGGTVIFFNGYTLHGSTIDNKKRKTRLALRYIFSPKKKSQNSLFQRSNKKIITNSFYIKDYRLDKMKNLYNKKCGKVINYVK